MDQTISPAVLTSTAATDHINNVVKPAVQDAIGGMSVMNASNVPNTSPTSIPSPTTSPSSATPPTSVSKPVATTSATNAPLNTYSYVSTDGTTKNVQGTSPADAMTKTGDIASHSGVQLLPQNESVTTTPSSGGTVSAGLSDEDLAAVKAQQNLTTPTSTNDTNSSTISDTQAQLKQAQADYQTAAQGVRTAISNIANGTTPLNPAEQAQVTALQNQFSQLITQQQAMNKGASGLANVRGYQAGAAEYDPTFQNNTIGAIVAGGIKKVSDLSMQEASAVAALSKSLQDNDIAHIKDEWAAYQDYSKNKTDALQKTIDDTQKAITEAQTAQQKVIDSVNDIASEAAKNGADPKTLATITAAGSVSNAIAAASGYLQTGSGDIGDYLQYKRDTTQKGLTPLDYSTWQAQQTAADAKAKASAAYSSAYATAAGKAAGDTASGAGTSTTDDAGTGIPGATGITQATGLSLAAFNYLTQGTASMSRMPAAQRNAIMAEANAYLNKTGTDISTFQSQFKAYNSVLSANIERANNTKIFAGEITGTVDQFVNDIGDKFGSLKAGNVAKLFAGQQVNDPTVQKYAFDLQTMQNDLAGYYAASRTGGSSATPDDSDKRAAAAVIQNGISGGSAEAFKQSIMDNESKVTNVVNGGVDSAQKQVWDLFGVGSQYAPKSAQVNPKDAVNNYVAKYPIGSKERTYVSNLYGIPGYDDAKVYEYMQDAGLIKQ